MKRKLIIKCLVILAAVGIVAGSTAAYFKAVTAQADNTFDSAYVNIALMQQGKSDYYEDNAQERNNLLQVSDISNLKNFYVLNKNSSDYPTGDTYVRVKLVPVCYDKDGNTAAVETSLDMTAGSGWEERSDGYWYYKQPLTPDEETSAFDMEVSSKTSLPEGGCLEVQVLAEGLQAYIAGMDYSKAWDITN